MIDIYTKQRNNDNKLKANKTIILLTLAILLLAANTYAQCPTTCCGSGMMGDVQINEVREKTTGVIFVATCTSNPNCGATVAGDYISCPNGCENQACITSQDNPPTLSIIVSPPTPIVNKNIDITVSATDDKGISKISVTYSGSSHDYSCGDPPKTCSHTWTTKETTAGTYTYTGSATDTAGHSQSEDKIVTVSATADCSSVTCPGTTKQSCEDPSPQCCEWRWVVTDTTTGDGEYKCVSLYQPGCVDKDKGSSDEKTASYVEFTNIFGAREVFVDECVGNLQLQERYCQDANQPGTRVVQCDYDSCKGTCQKKSISTTQGTKTSGRCVCPGSSECSEIENCGDYTSLGESACIDDSCGVEGCSWKNNECITTTGTRCTKDEECDSNQICDPTTKKCVEDTGEISQGVIEEIKDAVMNIACTVYCLIIGLVAGVAALVLMFSGLKYMTSEDAGARSEVRQRIIYSVVGLMIVIFACPLINLIFAGTDSGIGPCSCKQCTITWGGAGGPTNVGMTKSCTIGCYAVNAEYTGSCYLGDSCSGLGSGYVFPASSEKQYADLACKANAPDNPDKKDAVCCCKKTGGGTKTTGESCDSYSDCASGNYCNSDKKCAEKKDAGEACTASMLVSSDSNVNHICSFGTCSSGVCSAEEEGEGDLGESCGAHDYCDPPEKLYCSSQDHKCHAKLDNGEDCDDWMVYGGEGIGAKQCKSGICFNSGVCIPCTETSCQLLGNYKCDGGICVAS